MGGGVVHENESPCSEGEAIDGLAFLPGSDMNWIDPPMGGGRVKWDRGALGRIAELSGGGIRKPLKPGEMASLDRHIGGDGGGDSDTDTLSDYHGLLLSSNSSFRA